MFLPIVLFCVVFFGGFLTIIAVVKLRQVRAASKWPSVRGEIVSSQASSATTTTHHAADSDETDITQVRNYARISFRYAVAGKTYVGKRLSIGEDLGNDDVAGKLKRYPKGRIVQVFYDPADPATAVLERDLPEGCAKAGLIGLALVAAVIAFGFGLDYATDFLEPHLNTPSNASGVIFATTFSTLATLFTILYWRQGRAPRTWRKTSGQLDPSDGNTDLVYRYQVAAVPYASDQIIVGQPKRTKLPASVRNNGRSVTVFYDPADPTQACLATRNPIPWLPAIAAGFTGFLAWFLATQ